MAGLLPIRDRCVQDLMLSFLAAALMYSPVFGEERSHPGHTPRAESPIKSRAFASASERGLTEKEYLRLPEVNINIAEGALIIAKGIHPNTQVGEYLKTIDSFAAELRTQLRHDMGPQQVIATLNNYIFVKKGFKPNDISEGKSFLDTVIDEHGGNCIGLTCLYLSLAERLNIPLFAVAAPEHLFVRYKDNKTTINIETTGGGKSLTDEEIIAWLKVSPTSLRRGVFLDILSKRDVLAAMLTNRGQLLDDRGEHYKALADYSASIALHPKNPTAYNNRGAVHAILGQSEKALADFDTALSFDPNYAKAYCGRGTSHLSAGEYDKTLADINKALDLDPRQADAYNSRGLVSLQQRKYVSALTDFSRAVMLKEGYAEGYFNRSLAHALLGSKRDMLADLGKAIELDPKLKQSARLSPGFVKWRENIEFTDLTALTARTGPGPASPLKEFPLLYLYFDTFDEIDQAERARQLQIAIHANDPRSKDYSIEEVLTNEEVFLSLYRNNLLRVKLYNGFAICQSEESFYWDRVVNPEKYSDELRSRDAISRKLRKEIDEQVNAIRARYGL